jgi:hypothetical protein
MVDRKVVPFDEFYYQLKLMYLFQKHPVYSKRGSLFFNKEKDKIEKVINNA